MRTISAEWVKLRTLPGTIWLPLAAVALTVALGAAVTATADVKHCPSCYADTTKFSLYGVRLGQVALVVLAVLAISNEYSTRLIQSTLAATPVRMAVYGAKLAVVTLVGLVAGGLGVAGSLLAGGRMWSVPGDSATVRAGAGTILYCGLIVVLSFGVAAIVRDTAGAITAVLGLLFLAPMLAGFVSDPRWERRIQQLSPMDAGLAIQATSGLDGQPIGPWAGLGVLAGYAATAALIGALLFHHRDA